ncbi:kinase-like domain-containing protein [Gigaspora rosea]|uniref:Kinase-like domain-containing protein n=1 Tax=Gigaspora rosea TaxID=44941 RepID=A0A397V1V3_9GLOM|nr:kinase-like domain-containing protein [Gigaspora rosea]
MNYIEQGSLRDQLKEISTSTWDKKLNCLYEVSCGLVNIHEMNIVHQDFHSGNILNGNCKYNPTISPLIADLGLARPSFQSNFDKDVIYGVLPYVAPEVLRSKPYTKAADIYSFGIIMTEISTGISPFHDRPHDRNLAAEICGGLRPEFVRGTPQIYIDLVRQCTNADESKRPTAIEIREILEVWIYNEEFIKLFKEADKNMSISKSTIATINSEAYFTSRILKYSDLPKPMNSVEIRPFKKNNYVTTQVSLHLPNYDELSIDEDDNQEN